MYSVASNLQSVWTTEGDLRVHTRISSQSVPPERLPIWLVHGLSVSSRYMVPTGERLAPFFRVYAPDLPGFGQSDDPREVWDISQLADALIRRMDAFAVPCAVMVGNSLGCQIIANAAVRYPDRVAQTIMVGPTMDRHARRALTQAWRLAQDATLQESFASVVTQSYDYLVCGLRRTFGTLRYGLEDRIEDNLVRMSNPTLVVRGENDPIVPQRWAEEVTQFLPNARLLVLPNAPHAANYDDSGPLVAAILQFLGVQSALSVPQSSTLHH